MARISKAETEKRETFVRELFEKNPDLPAQKANDQVKAKFGSMMRPNRVYELRNQIRGSNGKKAATTEAPAAATEVKLRGRGPKRGKVAARVGVTAVTAPKRAGESYLVLNGNNADLDTLQRILKTLNESGATVAINAELTENLNALRS